VSSSLRLGGCAAEPREDRSAPAPVVQAELDSAALFMSWFSSVDIRSSHGRLSGGGAPPARCRSGRRAPRRGAVGDARGRREIPPSTDLADLEEPTDLTTWSIVLGSLTGVETDFREGDEPWLHEVKVRALLAQVREQPQGR